MHRWSADHPDHHVAPPLPRGLIGGPQTLPARSNFAPESRLVAFGEGACEAKVTRFKRAVAEDTYTYLDEANGKQACTMATIVFFF